MPFYSIPIDQRPFLPYLTPLAIAAQTLLQWIPHLGGLRTALALIYAITAFWIPTRYAALPNALDERTAVAGCGIYFHAQALVIVDRFLWSNIDRDFQRRLSDTKDDKQALEPVPKPLTWKRLKWALDLTVSIRGVGWNWQVSTLRPPYTNNRLLLIGRLLVHVILAFVTNDLGYIIMMSLQYPFKDISVYSMPLWKLFTFNICLAVQNIFLIPTSISLGTTVPLILHIYDPKDIRPIWGNVSSISSVTTLWKSFWHSGFRRLFVQFGRQVARLFPVQNRPALYLLIIIWTVFALNGFLHSLIVISMGGKGLKMMAFFLSQALVISIEGLLARLIKWRLPHWLGFIYAISLTLYLAGLYAEDYLETLSWDDGLKFYLVDPSTAWQASQRLRSFFAATLEKTEL